MVGSCCKSSVFRIVPTNIFFSDCDHEEENMGAKQNINSVLKILTKITTLKKILALVIISIVLLCCWNLKEIGSKPYYFNHRSNFDHFKRSRNLQDYIKAINILQEPSSLPCYDNVSILVTVASSPSHVKQREAIRSTWATRLRTLFIIGLNNAKEIDHLSDSHKGDLVVYQFQEHYQNLTLKTALMLKWTAENCSSKIKFLLKTDDDILINPWQIERIVKENLDADLIGYRNENAAVSHNEHEKWYLPRWLYVDDVVPEYLSGNAYLMNAKHIQTILKAAYTVPVINIEDIYFTFLVAEKKLGLRLTHEPRLRGFKPWLPLTRFYWNLASVHSVSPTEMLKWWSRFVTMAEEQ